MASNPLEKKNGRRQRVLSNGPTAASQPGIDDSDNVHLPHERDESVGRDSTASPGDGAAGEHQHRIGRQAASDLEHGQVDTDLHATPGLDAERRSKMAGTAASRKR